jgi:hypothetical protein
VGGSDAGDFRWRIYPSLREGTIIEPCTSRSCSGDGGSVSVLDVICKDRGRYCCCRGTGATELHLRFRRETVEGTRTFTSAACEVSNNLAETTVSQGRH